MAESKNDRAKEALEVLTGGAADGDPLAPGLDLADALDAGVLDGDWVAGSDALSEIPGDIPASDDSDGDGGDDGGDDDSGDSFVFDEVGADVLTTVLDATGTSDGVGGLSDPAHSTFDDSDAGGHGRSGALGSGSSDSAPRGESDPASSGSGSSSASSDAPSHGVDAGGVGNGSHGGDFPAFVESVSVAKGGVKGGKGADTLTGTEGTLTGTEGNDVLRGSKGEDTIDGLGGNDWIIGGHDGDILDGGAGEDTVIGGKGDDLLVHNVYQNMGATDRYDGGKGEDTLVLQMTVEEFLEYRDGLIEFKQWIDEYGDSYKSSSQGFQDASSNSDEHPLYETEFGLIVRNVEDLKIFVEGYDIPIDPEAGLPDDEDDDDEDDGGDEPPPDPDIIVTPGEDGIVKTGGDGTDLMIGTSGDDVLDGAGGDDLMLGGAGNDTLTGGSGNDLFVFKTGDGQDTVTDFEAGDSGGDLIDLRQMTAAASFTGVMAAAAQIGVDTFIDFGGGDTLTLENVLMDDLNAGDFLF